MVSDSGRGDREEREPFWFDDNGAETTFVENMKMLRERRGMSQTELAKRAHAKGLSFHQPTIQRIERGERPIKLGEAIALAGILGSTLEAMMKDTSLPFAYEHLASQIRACWEAVQANDGQSFPMVNSIRWNLNELEDAIEDYVAAVKRFQETPHPEIVRVATETHTTIEAGMTHLRDGERRAAEAWARLVDPDNLPTTFHSATPYTERQAGG